MCQLVPLEEWMIHVMSSPDDLVWTSGVRTRYGARLSWTVAMRQATAT